MNFNPACFWSVQTTRANTSTGFFFWSSMRIFRMDCPTSGRLTARRMPPQLTSNAGNVRGSEATSKINPDFEGTTPEFNN